MKQVFKRIVAILLSICITISFVMLCPISVFAKPTLDEDGHLHVYNWEDLKDAAPSFLQYMSAQVGAVCKGDFYSYVQNKEGWKNLWTEENVTISDEGKSVIASADLVSYIKQALIEYSEETNGYYLVKTATPSSLDVQQFYGKSLYTLLVGLVNQNGLIGVNMYNKSELNVCKFDGFYDNGYSFAFISSAKTWARIYNSEWQQKTFQTYRSKSSLDSENNVHFSLALNDDYAIQSSATYFHPSYIRASNGKLFDPGAYYLNQMCLISSDGRTLRFFKSLDALKLYSVGQRSVYFSKDFYESTPGEISGTWDEIADIVANIDKSLSDLLDKIDSTTDENTIEDLLQQILDELKGSGGGGGGSQGDDDPGGSYDDTGLLVVLSGYFDSVLAYLDQILSAIEALVWIEADDSSLTDDQKDLFDLIDKIWDNPETGSQEMADELSGSFLDVAKGITKKFPFSIPWDIHALFSVFARAGQSQPETAMLDDGYGIMPLVGEPDDGEYDYPNGDGTSTVIKWDENPHDAPYFVLPLVVESYGIEEYIEVDLKDFQTVSTLSRSLLAVLFAVFLIKFTISLMEFFRGGD